MDEEDAQISKIAACILVVIIVILATILLGCKTTETEQQAGMSACIICVGAGVSHSTKTTENDDE